MPRLSSVYQEPDFTVYLSPKEASDNSILSELKRSYDFELSLEIPGIATPVLCRALACRCNGHGHVSVTVRPRARISGAAKQPEYDASTRPQQLKDSEYLPNNVRDQLHEVTLSELCNSLWELIFDQGGVPVGLIVIAGRTGSAKSQTARGLIHRLLTNEQILTAWKSAKEGRRPHLVTLEDPIEARLYNCDHFDPFDPTKEAERLVDYTPRDKSRGDYKQLADALTDALRQTPTAVLVGEVRTKRDWQAIIDFAGTGHLVITTAHAGSVTETLAKIIEAAGAKEPEDLGRVAQRILAIVHQAPLPMDKVPLGKPPLIPTLWRQTPAGIASLISEGLSSVLPHRPSLDVLSARERSSLGRRWFVGMLLNRLANGNDADKALFAKLDKRAFELDLKGM
jgi:hypothetical protein